MVFVPVEEERKSAFISRDVKNNSVNVLNELNAIHLGSFASVENCGTITHTQN